MRPIGEVSHAALYWVRVGDTGGCELRCRDEVVAALFPIKASGTLYAAVAADGRWTFKRSGFLSPRVTVRRPGEETDAATLMLNWPRSGKLTFDDGRVYQWRAAHSRQHYSKWIDEGGTIVAKLTSWASPGRHDARVEIAPATSGVRDLSLLIMLGWYCVILGPELSPHIAAPREPRGELTMRTHDDT